MKQRICHLMSLLLLLLPVPFYLQAGPRKAFWYWGTSIIPERFNNLLKLPVDEIFLKCGDLYWENGEYLLKGLQIPQDYKADKCRLKVHLVIPFLFKEPPDRMKFISFIEKVIRESEVKLSRHGLSLSGIQLDWEGVLSVRDYTGLVDTLKLDRKKYRLSACFYPSFLDKPNAGELMKKFDFINIMFYDYQFDFNDYRITDREWIVSTAKVLAGLKVPFYIGLPVYGTISVYDEKKKLVYQQVDLPDMGIFKEPRFRTVERTAMLRKYELTENFGYKYLHFPEGWYFIVSSPAREYLAGLIAGINMSKELILGYCFFSYPLTDKYDLKEKDMRPLLEGIKK
ncbi:MAG: glycoside hydrolase family 18 protein [bacterium]|nr:glycoside hydrolase family 18 protein [bacterium]